jgi:putative membrane protein insertion efficiency factor
MTRGRRLAVRLLTAPIVLYRYTLSAFMGRECRYLPTCSEYAEDAIAKNGPWKGGWLALSRLCRCNPWGPSGYDPVPDLGHEHHPAWAPWRYGRWTGAHIGRQLDKTP